MPEDVAPVGRLPKMLSEQPTIHPTAEVTDSTVGAWTEIGARCRISETAIGDYSYVVHDCMIHATTIGKFCSIAAQVRLNPGNHPMERAALHHFTYRSRQFGLDDADDEAFFDWRRAHPVTLGHDVWIGHGATVLPGVTIGTGAAIGAGAIVSKDVAPFTIVVGVPAKPLRARFPEAVADGLLALAWWDWPRDRLATALPDFRALDAADFVRKYGG